MGVLNDVAQWAKRGITLGDEKHFPHGEYRPLGYNNHHDTEDSETTHSLLRGSAGRARVIIDSILPFPLQRHTSRTLPKLHSTSYMNGLRGIACVIVYINHIGYKYYPWIVNAYDGQQNSHILQLPVIRILISGHSSVCIFLVMSGFVLSYSPLRKIHAGDFEHLLGSLSSSILRRGIRLFAPVYALVLLTIVATWLYPEFDEGFQRGAWRYGDPSFLDHARALFITTLPLLNPFDFNIYFPRGLEHCWTLGAEWRGSMVVFLACVATCQMTTVARKASLVGAGLWCVHWSRYDVACFVAGMFLAELRHASLREDVASAVARLGLALPRFQPPRMLVIAATWGVASAAWAFVLVTLSWTNFGALAQQPYKVIADLTPWWLLNELSMGVLGSVVLLIILESSGLAQWVLSRAVFLYFGEISFAFYLLHSLVYRSLGDWLMFKLVLSWGVDYHTSFVIVFMVSLVALIWAADLFWRVIDETTVSVSRKLVDWLGINKPVSLAL